MHPAAPTPVHTPTSVAGTPAPLPCPECAHPAAGPTPPPAHWTSWRTWTPWAATLALTAVLLTLAARPGHRYTGTVRPRTQGSIFLGTPADLAAPPRGDGLVRALLATANTEAERLGIPFELVAAAGPSDAYLLITHTRGWPLITRRRSITAPFDAAGPPPDPAPLLEGQPWTTQSTDLLARNELRGVTTTEHLFTDASPLVLAVLAADLARRIARRILRRRVRNAVLWSLAAGIALLALATACALLPTSEQRGISPSAAPFTPLAPTGLTPDDLRALLGRDDADATLAAAILAALGPQPPADSLVQAGFRHTITWTSRLRCYGGPRMGDAAWYLDAVTLTTPDGEPHPVRPAWFGSFASDSTLSLRLPRWGSTNTAHGIGVNHALITPWLALVYAVAVLSSIAVRLTSRLIARRRHARGLCVNCGYRLAPAP